MQVQRCTYRRRKSFNTASNAVRKVKTPGGELVLHYVGKKGSGPRCGDCKKKLHGVRSASCVCPCPRKDGPQARGRLAAQPMGAFLRVCFRSAVAACRAAVLADGRLHIQ